MPIDVQALLKSVAEHVSENGLLDLVELLWKHDRRFTFPAFHRTAKDVAAKLREWDIKARTFELPADGKTLYGDWRMPLGWDCRAAKLTIHEPFEERGKVLGDAAERPTHAIMWSGPTPPTGSPRRSCAWPTPTTWSASASSSAGSSSSRRRIRWR
ncbi:MAG: hypothetical protein M5U26_10760 [Planctomycetota bacterium]|nr:hypothetical protein [Planctomycetota bacterium]